MASPANLNSPANIIPPISTAQPHIGHSLQQLSTMYTEIFDNHLRTLRVLQTASPPDQSVFGRTSIFIDAANETIEVISTLASAIAEANDPEKGPTRQIEDTINITRLYALTAQNKMYTALGSGTTFNASPAGMASNNMATDVSRYLDYVKAKHTERDFGDDSGGDEDA